MVAKTTRKNFTNKKSDIENRQLKPLNICPKANSVISHGKFNMKLLFSTKKEKKILFLIIICLLMRH